MLLLFLLFHFRRCCRHFRHDGRQQRHAASGCLMSLAFMFACIFAFFADAAVSRCCFLLERVRAAALCRAHARVARGCAVARGAL